MYEVHINMMAVEGVSDGQLGMGTDDDWRVLPGDGEVAQIPLPSRIRLNVECWRISAQSSGFPG